MIKTRKIGFLAALIVVTAVATILLTPDPTDDVDGLLPTHKVVKVFEQTSAISVAAVLPISRSAERSYLDLSTESSPQNVLRMLCTSRC